MTTNGQPEEGKMGDNIYWSRNGEDYTFGDLESLLGCYDDLVAGDVVYFGEAYHPDPIGWIDADDLIERLGERAYDDCGEWAEDYTDNISKEARAELDALLSAWYAKHAKPQFYKIDNEQKHTITQAEIDAANALGVSP